MDKNFLGVGWKFPVRADNDRKIAVSRYEEDIRESILIILGTAKGERVMRPNFGCGIHDLVFASINATTIGMVENNVREGLLYWEPRIEVIKVEARDDRAFEGKLMISIDYRVRITNNRSNLVYPFYLKEV
ncbi:MAG: GPW/gp25 family protein [Candidatus Methanoperedens sp.]|nr:GPW/gp25 family protein [Candidatus Methanoperedens sp.]CAG0963630.1 hypothetical protein METP1_00851 [Methanosarcinales archaeon]